jgi:cysteine desulfurase
MLADFANPSSEEHWAGWGARRRVEDARSIISESIGSDGDEIIFTSGATEADNLGVLGAALGAPAGRRSPVAGRRSPVAGRRSPVAGRRSPVAEEFWLVPRSTRL